MTQQQEQHRDRQNSQPEKPGSSPASAAPRMAMPIGKSVACSTVSRAASHIATVLVATLRTYSCSADSIAMVGVGIPCFPSAIP